MWTVCRVVLRYRPVGGAKERGVSTVYSTTTYTCQHTVVYQHIVEECAYVEQRNMRWIGMHIGQRFSVCHVHFKQIQV